MKSIKTKGLLFSFCIIIFSTVILGFNAEYRFKKILMTEVNEAVVRVAKESADQLSNHVLQYLKPLESMAEIPDIQSMDWEKQKKFIASQVLPDYFDIGVVDSKGIVHYGENATMDLSDRDYVKKSLFGKSNFSEVLISRLSGQPVIMVGVPIIKNQEVLGVLIARLDIYFFQDFIQTQSYGKNGRAYIISDVGTFIARPEAESREGIYNLYDLADSDLRYASLADLITESKSNDSGYGKFSYEGTNIIMGYASVEQTNWKVYIGSNENDILKSLNGLKRTMLLFMAATLILVSCAAFIFVNRFSRSIIEIDNLFAQGAMGNLTIRFNPKTKDELGRLGISFNRLMDKIKTLTQYDPLTTLLNQYVLEKDIETLIHSDTVQGFTLIMIAINKFSSINETYGYTGGDAVLYEAAKRITGGISGYHQVYRYKGDEFVVMFRNELHEEESASKAQAILSLLSESFQINDRTIDIHVSIGVFIWNEDTRADNPINAVTHAVNYAKYLGGNQIQIFERQIYKKLMVMKELQSEIIAGLGEEQFFLVYQPLFYLEDESMAEIETLIRWQHPTRGLLYPDQFIELAEEAGTIVNIDLWVLETACRQLREWKNCHRPTMILSVNISAQTFETKSFVPSLVEIIQKYNIDPALLQLEITERVVIKNVEESISKLNELRAMGIQIAIDDFGIGYSSLSYIVQLPIDSIKIDKSFVKDINSCQKAKVIVSTIINLCKSLELRVIAEGIESVPELEYLKQNRCDIGQGYYFSRPVSVTDLKNKYWPDQAM